MRISIAGTLVIGGTTCEKAKASTDGPMVTGIAVNTTKANLMVTESTAAQKATVTSVILQTAIFTARDSSHLEQLIVLEINMKAIFIKANFMGMARIFTLMAIGLWAVFDSAKRMVVEFCTHIMAKRFLVGGETIN